MKILFAHNYYRSAAPSGENIVFEAERTLLRKHGHEVREYTRHSDEIAAGGLLGLLTTAAFTPWNPQSAATIRRLAKDFAPDIVHVHNSFPLLSPSVFYAVGIRAARILRLPNYRLFCAAGVPLRHAGACTECIDRRSALPGLRHRCYRDSHIATLPLTLNIALHRALETWSTQVDAFIVLTDFAKELMIRGGLPEDRIFVKPNFYPGNPSFLRWDERRDEVVYAGRLSTEKGVESLVKAWVTWGDAAPMLRIIGDGPLREHLQQTADNSNRISFAGQLSPEATVAQISGARLVVIPSECFEGFPMVAREAFAFGTPVAASAIGPLPSIVTPGVNGILFKPRDPEGMVTAIRQEWMSRGNLERLGAGARRTFETLYNEESNYQILMRIYEQAVDHRRKRLGDGLR